MKNPIKHKQIRIVDRVSGKLRRVLHLERVRLSEHQRTSVKLDSYYSLDWCVIIRPTQLEAALEEICLSLKKVSFGGYEGTPRDLPKNKILSFFRPTANI